MNNLKKNGGFTLVELIVVIAILGILAAVAVPAYSGYITKAKEAGDITQLDAIKTAAMACAAQKGAVTQIDITTDEGKITDIVATLDVVKTAANGTNPAVYETMTLVDHTANPKVSADFKLFYGSDEMPTMQSETYSKEDTLAWYATVNDDGDDDVEEGEHPAGWVVVEAADDD